MRLAQGVSVLAVAASAAVASAQTASTSKPPAASRLPHIVLVGDSTVTEGSGWGLGFRQLVAPGVRITNTAQNGRSSKSFRDEGHWDKAIATKADYVLIQFGHNDQPGKPGRSTDLATEFPANLRRYVAEARAAGAVPVLLTPLTRRQFKSGTLIDDLGPWAEATRRVAAEVGAPLVDLHARSRAAVQGMGAATAMRFAQRPPSSEVWAAGTSGTTIEASGSAPPAAAPAAQPAPQRPAEANAANEPMGQPRLAFDYTHLGSEGADFFAALVVEELARAVPPLRRNLLP